MGPEIKHCLKYWDYREPFTPEICKDICLPIATLKWIKLVPMSFRSWSKLEFLSRYLECVSKNMKKLQPFGDVPKKLTLQLRRSFVATRTFSQALVEGKKVLSKILKIPPRDKCAEALTKMTSCPACQGLPAIRPCSSYCLNVMKGCLAYHAELSDSWDKFVGKKHLSIVMVSSLLLHSLF